MKTPTYLAGFAGAIILSFPSCAIRPAPPLHQQANAARAVERVYNAQSGDWKTAMEVH